MAGGMPVPGRDQRSVTSQISFLEAGARFEGDIRFHNLHPVELGALLCALALGEKSAPTRHSMGHAKAFGYGRLSCQTSLQARPNFGQGVDTSVSKFIGLFRKHMEEWYRDERLAGEWASSPQVQTLLKMSYPVQSPTLNQRLGFIGEVKDFAGFKKGPRPVALPEYAREFDQMEQPRPELGAFLRAE
jgi:hypothetical protein